MMTEDDWFFVVVLFLFFFVVEFMTDDKMTWMVVVNENEIQILSQNNYIRDLNGRNVDPKK